MNFEEMDTKNSAKYEETRLISSDHTSRVQIYRKVSIICRAPSPAMNVKWGSTCKVRNLQCVHQASAINSIVLATLLMIALDVRLLLVTMETGLVSMELNLCRLLYGIGIIGTYPETFYVKHYRHYMAN